MKNRERYDLYPIDLIAIRDRKQQLARNVVKCWNVNCNREEVKSIDANKEIHRILNEKQVELEKLIKQHS